MRITGAGERLVFEPMDFAGAEPVIGPGGAAVAFRLRAEAGAIFAAFTERAIGQEVSVEVCGRLLVRTVVQARLGSDGILPANGIEDADLLAELLRGDTECGAGARD